MQLAASSVSEPVASLHASHHPPQECPNIVVQLNMFDLGNARLNRFAERLDALLMAF